MGSSSGSGSHFQRERHAGVRWLVDGMNLIGSRAGGWWKDRDRAIRGLIEELATYASSTGEHVSVVFDHRPRRVPSRRGPVAVRFGLGEDQAADRLILRMVQEDSGLGSLRVVTSDRALRRDVEASGAATVSVTAFERRLRAKGPRRHRPGAS